MKPKEEAQVLFSEMIQAIGSDCEHESYCMKPQCEYNGMVICVVNQDQAKQCALIAVNKLIVESQSVLAMLKVHGNGRNRLPIQIRLTELSEVKEEINKL